MKKIEAIIRPEKMDDLQEALTKAGVHGMTISQVHGCGTQHGFTEYYRGSEVIVSLQSKIKIEVVLPDSEVQGIVRLICNVAYTGEPGDGKIFVIPIEEVVRVRTGATGLDALV